MAGLIQMFDSKPLFQAAIVLAAGLLVRFSLKLYQVRRRFRKFSQDGLVGAELETQYFEDKLTILADAPSQLSLWPPC